MAYDSSEDGYLIHGVSPEEFNELKGQEAEIDAAVLSSLNDTWKPRVRGIKSTFKYNPNRRMIGIYIERSGQQQLVFDAGGLTEEEDAVVYGLHRELRQKIDRIQLPRETWLG